VAAALDEANAASTTLYHGGVLRDGVVGAGDFSTTESFEHASQYAAMHGGQVWRFDVPNSVMRTIKTEGGFDFITDSLQGTASAAPEIKFLGQFSLQLRNYVTPVN
jgi:hypothetical protein